MTVKNLNPNSESPGLCPACGADFTQTAGSGDVQCRNCRLMRFGALQPASCEAMVLPQHRGADLALIGQLEQNADPAEPLLLARDSLSPGAVLYLEIGSGGFWLFSRKSLMLLMERCGFRLIRKLDRAGRQGFYRRY